MWISCFFLPEMVNKVEYILTHPDLTTEPGLLKASQPLLKRSLHGAWRKRQRPIMVETCKAVCQCDVATAAAAADAADDDDGEYNEVRVGPGGDLSVDIDVSKSSTNSSTSPAFS